MWMTNSIGKKIVRLTSQGFDFQVGPHNEELSGYYAWVYRAEDIPVCDECETPIDCSWQECGHGHSISEALYNAELLANSKEAWTVYKPEDFCEVCVDTPPDPTSLQ